MKHNQPDSNISSNTLLLSTLIHSEKPLDKIVLFVFFTDKICTE